MSTPDEQEAALRMLCRRHGYAPAIVVLSLDDMKRRDGDDGSLPMDTIMPNGKRLK